MEGAVFYDPNFPFHDGEFGQKLFVILNNGQDGSFLTVLTTTKQKRMSGVAGCHANDFPANYHCSGGSDFPEDSWLLIGEIYEFDCYIVMQKIKQALIAQKAPVSSKTLIDVLDCTINSQDLSLDHQHRLELFRTSL